MPLGLEGSAILSIDRHCFECNRWAAISCVNALFSNGVTNVILINL